MFEVMRYELSLLFQSHGIKKNHRIFNILICVHHGRSKVYQVITVIVVTEYLLTHSYVKNIKVNANNIDNGSYLYRVLKHCSA